MIEIDFMQFWPLFFLLISTFMMGWVIGGMWVNNRYGKMFMDEMSMLKKKRGAHD